MREIGARVRDRKKASTERETMNKDVVMETWDIPWLWSRRAMWDLAGPGNLTGRAGVSNKKGQEVIVSVDLHAKRQSAAVGIRRAGDG